MPFPQLSPTNAGKAMLLAACAGYPLKFTKIVLGNGNRPANQDLLTLVQNPQAEAGIDTHTRTGTHSVVHWHLDSEAVENSFDWMEYGVYATNTLDGNGDPVEGTDVLFSYAYNEGSPQPVEPIADTPVLLEGDLNIAVGSAEHVSAVVSEYSAYASKEAFNEHISQSNPHGTSAEDVGLGHVNDTSDTDAVPIFEEAESLVTINSGETAGTLWGKVKKLFTSYLAHINSRNGHGTRPSDIGAATEGHKHSAGDIISGVLGIANGGTGAAGVSGAKTNLGISNLGVLVEDWTTSESSVAANKYRTIRTLNIPKGTWVITLRLLVDNWAQLGNAQIFITDEKYNNSTSFNGAHPANITEVTLDNQDSSKTTMVTFIYVSDGTNKYITVNPSKASSWGCMWRAVGII